jgi:hypothetical protein
MVEKSELVFVTTAWVADNLGIAKAEQARKRIAGKFPLLVVLGDDARDPQARVAYRYEEITEWAETRPRRPVRLKPQDDSE